VIAGGSTNASAAEYETITVPSGTVQGVLVDGTQTHENKLYDVTAEGAGVTFRLMGNATIRNVGIKGQNSSSKFVFRIGGGVDEVTIDRVYTENFDTSLREPGGIILTKNSGGTVNVRGSSIHGFGNNGIYASKTDADLYVEDCFHTNNRTSNFRAGGDYHGNNRDAIFRNCVTYVDERMADVPLYPSGGDRTVGFVARWGDVQVEGCQAWFKDSAPLQSNWYVLRTDGHTGSPSMTVSDSEISPRDRISGDITYASNVGSDPTDIAPDYAPVSAEDAASGYTSDGSSGGSTDTSTDTSTSTSDPSVAVSTASAADVTETGATLRGELTSLQDASSADVGFEYRAVGASSWTATAGQTLSSTGTFSASVDGLAGGTDYEYRAVAAAGDSASDTGSTVSFTTVQPTTLSNTLEIDGTVTDEFVEYEITVSGDIEKGDDANPDDAVEGSTAVGQVMGGLDSYQFSGEVTDVQLTGDVPVLVDGTELDLSPSRELRIDGSSLDHVVEYEITVSDEIVKGDGANPNDAVEGTTADGQVNGGVDTYLFSGEVTEVLVTEAIPIAVDGTQLDQSEFESLYNPPAVDRYEVTEAGSPNPHADIVAEWDVSDADGDLAEVTVEVLDESGAVADSSTTSVDGDVAYGVDYFEIKNADGQTFEVRVTVTDADGNESSAARSVQE